MLFTHACMKLNICESDVEIRMKRKPPTDMFEKKECSKSLPNSEIPMKRYSLTSTHSYKPEQGKMEKQNNEKENWSVMREIVLMYEAHN